MCLIIHNPKGKLIPSLFIDNALCTNPDGFGIFWHDTGAVEYSMSDNHVATLLDTDRPYTAHFRYATSGPVGLKQCHPFHIDDTYALMMNGTIARLVSKKQVDTERLCQLLAGLTEEKMLEVLRTHPCRFVLLNKQSGAAIVVNRDLWHKRNGVLYSKDNCFDDPWAKPKYKSMGYNTEWFTGKPTVDPEEPDTWANEEPEDVVYYDDEYAYEDICCAPAEPIEDDLPSGNRHIVAVYGTLKRGHGNHRLLSNAKFLGTGHTQNRYPMFGDGIPFLVNKPNVGNWIVVEAYEVSTKELQALDRLEQHPHWYERVQLPVTIVGYTGTLSLTAWVYTIDPQDCVGLTGMDYRKVTLIDRF